MDVETIGAGTVLVAVAGVVGRWLGARSAERTAAKKIDTDERQATLGKALERIAALEARSDMLQTQLAAEQQQRAAERVRAVEEITTLRAQVAQLMRERDDARAENVRLREQCPLDPGRACTLVRSGGAPVPMAAAG